MLIILYFIAVLFGLFFYKSKIINAFQHIVIYIIFVFNNWSQDEIIYRGIYAGHYGSSHEPGFDLICHFFYSRGVSFELFRIVYTSIAVIILLGAFHIGFNKASNRAYSLAMLYPLLPLVELLRNLMAIAIVLYGINRVYLSKDGGDNNKIHLAIFVALGATFHYNVLFFLILLIIDEIGPSKSTYIRILIISISSIVLCNAPAFRGIIRFIFKSSKILNWFDPSKRIGIGLLLVLAFHIVSFCIYDSIYRIYFHSNFIINKENNFEIMAKRIYSINVYSFVLVGFYTYNMEFFSRIYIVVILLNCFHVSLITRRIRSFNMQILHLLQVVYHVAMFFYFCQPINNEGIMSFVIGNNLLFP